MAEKTCIVCGRKIKKRMRSLSFLPATLNGRDNGERSSNGRTIYLDDHLRPEGREAAQRYTNHEIRRVVMSGDRVFEIVWWEGEYESDFFCTQTCAIKQGYASAKHGERYTWRKG